MQPTFALRIFLFWLEWQARRRGMVPRSVPIDVVPDIPAPMLSATALAHLRCVTGRPSFPQCLSSLRIRKWIEITVPGEVGERPARLYRPKGKVTGIVLFLHGGGFVHCDTTSHHGICCRLAAASGAMVLSLDYRLAPEHRFPAGLRDAQAALKWLRQVAPKLPIAVAGDSAGGNLSAALTHWSRIDPDITLAAQLLYYPAVSGPIIPASRQAYGQGYMLTTELLHWYCGQTLAAPRDLFDPEFSPVFAETFKNLPPAMIVTAGFDPLRGEGELYTRLLREGGVSVRYRLFPRMIHGFLNGYALFRDGRTALREGGEFLKEVFRKAGAVPS